MYRSPAHALKNLPSDWTYLNQTIHMYILPSVPMFYPVNKLWVRVWVRLRIRTRSRTHILLL